MHNPQTSQVMKQVGDYSAAIPPSQPVPIKVVAIVEGHWTGRMRLSPHEDRIIGWGGGGSFVNLH